MEKILTDGSGNALALIGNDYSTQNGSFLKTNRNAGSWLNDPSKFYRLSVRKFVDKPRSSPPRRGEDRRYFDKGYQRRSTPPPRSGKDNRVERSRPYNGNNEDDRRSRTDSNSETHSDSSLGSQSEAIDEVCEYMKISPNKIDFKVCVAQFNDWAQNNIHRFERFPCLYCKPKTPIRSIETFERHFFDHRKQWEQENEHMHSIMWNYSFCENSSL